MSAVYYWIWFSRLRGVSPQSKRELLAYFGDPKLIFHASDEELSKAAELKTAELSALRAGDSEAVINSILDDCYNQNIHILTMQDAIYPERLKNIYDPPMVLYIKGSLPFVDKEVAVGIVGTRKATPYGKKMALNFGHDLTKKGGFIISGLASGIDAAGAEGALRAGGSCIGVLGTGIDQVYPRENKWLFDDVCAVGALISEYPPNSEFNPHFFPMRNRIISGLSLGVLIIEAPKRSGALITANHALEQGRDVFVVPGNADAYNSEGSNLLLKDSAKAVLTAEDILCEYSERFPGRIKNLYDEEKMPEEMEKLSFEMRPVGDEEKSERQKLSPRRRKNEEAFAMVRQPVIKKVIDKARDEAYIDLENQLKNLNENQLKIIAAIDEPHSHVDEIIKKSGLSAGRVLSELTILELLGFISQDRDKRFRLNINKPL